MPHGADGILLDIDAVDQNLSIGHVVQAQDQLDNGRFACAVSSDQSNVFTAVNLKGDIFQDHLFMIRIMERNV